MNVRRISQVVAFAWLPLLFGCGRRGGAVTTPDAAPIVIGAEGVAVATLQTIQTGARIAGTLAARDRAAVRAEVGGSVTAVRAELGQSVRRGQTLARIESRGLEEGAVGARSAVRSAEQGLLVQARQLERTERLVRAGGLADRELDLARSAVVTAQAQLDDARARAASAADQLGQTRVSAPIAGVVSERAVNRGDVVAPGAALFTIIDPSGMQLEAAVPSDALSALRVGTPVVFSVRGYGTQTFTGKIARISPEADPATRQIPVLVSLPNIDGRLVAGLYAEGRLASTSRRALVVPQAAVNLDATPNTVLRLRDDSVEQVTVETGVRDEAERVEIVRGLQAGDRVLLGAARDVAPGARVQLRAAADAGPAPPGHDAGVPVPRQARVAPRHARSPEAR